MRSWYSYTRRLWRLPNSINQPINHSINQSIATALDAVATKGHVLWLRYYPIDLTNPSPQPLVNNKRTLQASREGGGAHKEGPYITHPSRAYATTLTGSGLAQKTGKHSATKKEALGRGWGILVLSSFLACLLPPIIHTSYMAM